MDRRYFIRNTAIAGTAIAIVPTSILFAEKIQNTTQDIIEYSSDKVNALNDYAMGAILPSLAAFAIYAYTMELIYVVLFIFLLITAGIII
ncbi:hypothetical protein N8299_03960 [Gammaproteobacteria bacterium]|jgi:hypothetical protein|nr:hypothetical protein [Gammaproteobacteria bacterium]|tara:strand:- start:296 stop:565 length:270 start_codon:yes stop_codon:yes gene_type:complete